MYSIIVWNRDATHGVHNRVLMSGKTQTKLLRDFAQYLSRPVQYRSFTGDAALHHDERGFICNIPAL